MLSLNYERNPSKLQTNSIYLYLSGSLYDGTCKSVFSSVFRIFFLIVGFTEYILKIFLHDEGDSKLMIMEALHWAIVFFSVTTLVISCLVKSSLFLKMQAMVKSGVYDYEGNMSEEQIVARATANREIQFSTSVFSTCCFAALLASYFKAPLFMQKFSLPYPIWLPYKINSYLSFFFDLQSYFNISLLVTAFSTGLILCTFGYLFTSPETSLAMTGSLLLVLIPELCIAGYYCVLGQNITDVTEDVGITIYSLKWYTMPLPVQRDLLMMLVGSKKTRQLTGLGLHEFSIKGLSEILQASFTYFNMLMALSGGK